MATASKKSDEKICDSCTSKRTIAITSCHGCNRHFCQQHFKTHRDQLSKSLNDHSHLRNEIAQDLKTRSAQLNPNDVKRLLREIDQWEERTIDECRQIATERRNFVTKSFDTSQEHDVFLQRLASIAGELEEQQRVENFIERDIERWMKQLKDLQKDINQTIKSPTNAMIETKKIDWKKMISISLPSDSKHIVKHYVLVSGEKGVGKTTFIRYVVNFFAKKCTFADRLPLKAIQCNDKMFINSNSSKERTVIDQYSFSIDNRTILVFLDCCIGDIDDDELDTVLNQLGISKFAGIVMIMDATDKGAPKIDEDDFLRNDLFKESGELQDICNLCHKLSAIFVNCSNDVLSVERLKSVNHGNIGLYFVQNSAYQQYRSRSLTDSVEVDYKRSMKTIEKIVKEILHEI